MNKLLVPLAGLAILAPVAHGQVTKTKEGFLLRAKYQKGAIHKFNMQNSVGGPKGQTGVGTKFSMPITLQVLDVAKSVATVKLTMGGVKVGDTVIRPGQSATVKLTNRNTGADGGAQNIGAQLPKGAIRVGESWAAKAPVNSEMGRGTLDARYTFRGLKTVAGKAMALITYTLSGYASGEGKMAILVADGILYSNQVQLKLNMGGQTPLVVTSIMNRL